MQRISAGSIPEDPLCANFASQTASRGLCGAFNPADNTVMKTWDLMSAVLLVLVAFLTPIEAGFLSCAEFLGFRYVLNQIINVFFVCDLVIQFFLPYQVSKGKAMVTIYQPIAIVKHYLTTWFLVDFVSVIPYEFIAPCAEAKASGMNLGALRAVRMLRLLKLLKLLRGFRMFSRWEMEFGFSKRKMTLYTICGSVIVGAHWITCVLGLVSRLQAGAGDACLYLPHDRRDEDDSCVVTWLTVAHKWYDEDEIRSPFVELNAYLISLHASMSILVHPHSYAPTSIVERLVFSLLMLFGGYIWTQVISRSTAMVTSLDAHNIAFASLMDDVNLISADLNLSKDIRRRLRKYFLKMKSKSKQDRWNLIMTMVSPKLRQDCAKEINRGWVLKVSFISRLNRAILAELAEKMCLESFAETENFGEQHRMYILKEGTAITNLQRGNFKTLVETAVWGEDHLLLDCLYLLSDNTAKALTYIQVHSLKKMDFDSVICMYPQDQMNIRKVVVKYAVIRGVCHLAEEVKGRPQAGWTSDDGNFTEDDDYDRMHRSRRTMVMNDTANNAADVLAAKATAATGGLANEQLTAQMEALRNQQDALARQHEELLTLVRRIALTTDALASSPAFCAADGVQIEIESFTHASRREGLAPAPGSIFAAARASVSGPAASVHPAQAVGAAFASLDTGDLDI